MTGDGTGRLSRGGSSPFGLAPAALGAGDFNGDGKLDVAVANATGTITILAGSGTGALTPLPLSVPPLTAGTGPSSLTVADLDRDGKLDLAVANGGSGDLSVLLGNGTGGFTAAPGTPVATGGNAPSAIAAGDLNGDGKLDLAAVNGGNGSVSVLLNGVAPPVAGFAAFPGAPLIGQPVTFAYTAAGAIDAIDWDLNGDGIFDDAHGPSATRMFALPGNYPISLRVTDLTGLASTTTQLISVGLPFSLGGGRVAAPSGPALISPFPIVRVTGRTNPRGARIKALEVFAPAGVRVTVDCRGKGCPFRKWRRTAGAKPLSVDRLKGRFLAAGATVQVRVYKSGQVGKYTRIVVRKLKPPVRNDQCLAPGSSSPSPCPVS
jgi:hypothetical protein